MREADVIERLRRIATAPEARGLLDDVAVLGDLVITHDSIAEGVHFLSSDPPASVGWKLVAVNLSDLAAKGATPAGALMSLTVSGPGKWEHHFLDGVEAACESYGLPLIGGDTIALPGGRAARARADRDRPRRAARSRSRRGEAGRFLWLVGTVGDAAAGLAQLRADRRATGPLVDIFRRPVPQLKAGRALAPLARAIMDVSDGLLLDARRMAQASRCSAAIELDALPLSAPLSPTADRTFAAGCSPPPAATTMPCSPPCRRTSTRQRFLYQGGRGSPASARWRPVGHPFASPSPARPSSFRKGWALSTLGQTIAGFPLRQWLIGLSGLASGMALALLLH